MQTPQQSVEDWIIKVKELANEFKRYGPEIPFDRFAEQILIGTKATSFVIKFRQVFRPLNPILRPTVRNYEEFEQWFTAWKTQQREIERQKERQNQISGKSQPKAGLAKGPRSTPKKPLTNVKKEKQKTSERRPPQDKFEKLKKRLFPKDNSSKPRLPHSRLFRRSRKEPPDMSKIKCYNCGKLGHYASKCPEVKRERTPLMEAYLCGLTQPSSSEEEDEADVTITSVDDAIQDASDRFADSLRTLLGGMQVTSVPTDEDESQKEDSSTRLDEDEDQDNESVFTYASAELNAQSAALHNLRADITSSMSEPKESSPTVGSFSPTNVGHLTRWTLDDLMDRQQGDWSEELHLANSTWCDMVWPRMQGVFARWGLGELNCSIGEVQHLLLLAVFLQVGTHKGMTACLRGLTRPAMLAWAAGRRAHRTLWESVKALATKWEFRPVLAIGAEKEMTRVMRICMDHNLMASVYDPWTMTDVEDGVLVQETRDDSVTSTDKSSTPQTSTTSPDPPPTDVGSENERSLHHTVVGRLDEDGSLSSLSLWVSKERLVISDPIRVLIMYQGSSISDCLDRIDSDLPLLAHHPERGRLRQELDFYDLAGSEESEKEKGRIKGTVWTGDIQLWHTFTGVIEDVGKTSSEAVPKGVHSSAARMFACVASGTDRARPPSLMAQLITRTENYGSFASLWVGGRLKPWFHDSGSLLSQMTPEEIEKCDPPLEFVTSEIVHFIFAESMRSKVMRIFKATGICLVNPRTGAVSREITAYVGENADLKVYPRVLGKNFLARLQISTHHESGTMSDSSGNTWTLWNVTDELSQRRDVGEFQSFVDRSSFKDALRDYAAGVLIQPPVDLSSNRLYPIRLQAISGDWGDRYPRDPDYIWSERKFLSANQHGDTGYFMEAVLLDMAKVQRLLKRSQVSFTPFIVFMSEWFRACPLLLELWREVWAAGTVDKPKVERISKSKKRERRLARLGFSPSGFQQKRKEDVQEVSRAMEIVKSFHDEDEDMHRRIATSYLPIGVEPVTPPGDVSVGLADLGKKIIGMDLTTQASPTPSMDGDNSSDELLRQTSELFDSPLMVSEAADDSPLAKHSGRDRSKISDRPLGIKERISESSGSDSSSSKGSTTSADVAELFHTPAKTAKAEASSIAGKAVMDTQCKESSESSSDDSPIIRPRRRRGKTTDEVSPVEEVEEKDEIDSEADRMLRSIPVGVLDREATRLLRSPTSTTLPQSRKTRKKRNRTKKKGVDPIPLRTYSAQIKGSPRPKRSNRPRQQVTLQAMVSAAADQGAYVPVLIGDVLTVWHYDSGAGLSQISPKALAQLIHLLEKVDWDDVKFVTAKDVSTANMTLYRIKSCALMQMESQVVSQGAESYVVCNPDLRTYDRLLGINTMKALQLCDRHVNDVVEDPIGRPFRKYSRNQLAQLQQSVDAWNRRRKLSSRPSRPPIQLRQETEPVVATPARLGRSGSRARVKPTNGQSDLKELQEKVKQAVKRLEEAESHDDRGVFARLMKTDMQGVQRHLLRLGLDPQRVYPNFFSFLRAKWREDPQFAHRWKGLWSRRREGLHRTSRRELVYEIPDQPGPPLPPLPPAENAFSESQGSPRRREKNVGKSDAAHNKVENTKTESKVPPPLPPRKERSNPNGAKGDSLQQASPGRPTQTSPWQMDPTPPWLKEPIVFSSVSFPDSPLEINPDLMKELRSKAKSRWTRPFDVHCMGSQTRVLSNEKSDVRLPLWKRPRICLDHACLVVPGPASVKKTCEVLLKAQRRCPSTSALLLLPEDLSQRPGVKDFLHAYCQRGEAYRYGPLFRKEGDKEWLHLNQAVHEYWFDPIKVSRPQLTDRQQGQLDELLDEFKDCVGDSNTSNAKRQSTAENRVPYVRLPVKAGYVRSSDPPFKKNPKTRQLTIDFVRDMEKRGLVSRCTAEEAEFVCNSLMLPKGMDKYRFVCTFSGLNANMLRDPYGMRTLDAVLTALEGSSWFSVLDVVDGFFNLPLYPADRGFTAFHTPIGMFKWNVLPQGTSASPQIFQRTMDRWFAAFLWRSVIVWVDDLLVHSSSFDAHLQHLRGVFEVARRYGLVFNKAKMKLCQREVQYIGYIFGEGGISTDPGKVAAVHDMPVPNSRKQVKSFLGFAGFYRRFMPPDYASIIAPLTELTKPSIPFRWSQATQRAFDRVKLLLTTTPVLVHPDFSLPFHVHCDASGKGIGGVLSQYINGAYRPVAFCSKRLLPHQQHWSPAQLEAYAVFYCVCVKWRYYLTLNRTIVHSDHRNLAWLFNHAQKGMIGRWYAQLAAYDLDITYVTGKSQVMADPLSRILKADLRPTLAPGEGMKPLVSLLSQLSGFKIRHAWRGTQETEAFWIEAMPAGIVTPAGKRWESLQHMVRKQFTGAHLARNMPRGVWASHQRQDAWLGPIMAHLSATGRQPVKSSDNRVRAIAQSFRLKGGVLHYRSVRDLGVKPLDEGWTVAVPRSLQDKIISECHSDNVHGHRGVTKTVWAIRQRYYFKKIRSCVERFIRECGLCVRAKAHVDSHELPLTPIVATRPFVAVAMDLYSPGEALEGGWKYVLTIVDICTRWVQFIPLRTKLASEVMVNFCRFWIHFHGVPEFMLSDQGKEFMGVASVVCTLLDIKHIRTSPYHPQTNGLCEVQHKTLTRELRIRSQRPNAPTWLDVLSEVQFALNISHADEQPHLSPFELVFGRAPRLAAQDITFPDTKAIIAATKKDLQQWQSQHLRTLEAMRFRAADNQVERKLAARNKRDRHRNPPLKETISRGMLVHIEKPTRSLKKLTYQWTAPNYLVTKCGHSTCCVTPLVSPAGREGKIPKAITVNRSKMKSHGKPPCGFWIGSRVLREFNGQRYVGTIVDAEEDEGAVFFRVSYADFDEEELDYGEVVDAVIYHPELDAAQTGLRTPQLPREGTFVLFAADYEPRVGKVMELHPAQRKPIVVQMWRPRQPPRGRADLSTAQYATRDAEDNPDRRSLTLAQVRLHNLHMTEEAKWEENSKVLVKKTLRLWRRGADQVRGGSV